MPAALALAGRPSQLEIDSSVLQIYSQMARLKPRTRRNKPLKAGPLRSGLCEAQPANQRRFWAKMLVMKCQNFRCLVLVN